MKKEAGNGFFFCFAVDRHKVLLKQGKEILSPMDARQSHRREAHHMPQDYGRKISSRRPAIPQ